MKRTLFILTAAAGMFLLGGASAKADESEGSSYDETTGEWSLTVAPSTGTFYRDSDGNTSSAWKDRWVSNYSPTITIADADGSITNNMTFDETLDGITLAEGSGSSYSYTVSVKYGYLISGMELKAKTTVSDMTLTVGETSQSLTANTEATFSLSDINQQSVGITVSSTSGSNESVTLYNWTVTVVKDPDAKDFSVDLSHKKITAISSDAITSQPEEGKWYLMKNDRHGDTGAYGDWSPVYDNGEGNTMMRAADDNVVQVGDMAEDVAKYLLRFFTADKTSTALEKSVVVNPQWATGNFWTSTLTTTSDFGSAGSYNMYLTSSTSGTSTFAFNLYDMGSIVDNNGVGAKLEFWSTGEVIATSSGANNIWWLYEVTLGEMSDEDEEAVAQAERNEKLLEVIEQAYDAYEANCGYEDLVLESAGDNLIKSADQLSSPYTESGSDLGNLIDNNIGTHWDSKWSSGNVDNGVHYIQVELPDDFEGGEIQVYIERRNDTYNNHITEMSVKGIVSDEYDREAAYRIALLELPYAFHYSEGEEEYAGFTCPAGVKTLRFYEEATAGVDQYNVGFWHLAEFHLYASSLTDDCGNTTLKAEKKEALLAAINTALEKYGSCTEEDIATLKTAISTYLNENISWTLGADYGTLILPFNDDVSVESGLTVYPCTGVSDSEVQLGSAVDAIAPKTPYIVSGTANSTPITFSGAASFKTSLYSDAKDLLTGTLTGTTAPTNSYVLQDHDGTLAFYLVDSSEEITVGAYHCYLTLPDAGGNAKAVVYFPSSGVATAIEAVDGITTDSEAIYDLSGRKVTNPRSGIYIKGGKKVIIK